jgi:hypothetical protein
VSLVRTDETPTLNELESYFIKFVKKKKNSIFLLLVLLLDTDTPYRK